MSSAENEPYRVPRKRAPRSWGVFGVVSALTFGSLLCNTQTDASEVAPINQGAIATEKAVRLSPPTPVLRPPEVVEIGDSIAVLKYSYGDFEMKIAAGGVVLTVSDNKGARPQVWWQCDKDPASLACEGDAWDAGRHIGVGDGIRSADHAAAAIAAARVVVLDLGQNTFTADLAADTTRIAQHAYELSAVDGIPAIIAMSNMAHTNSSYVGPASLRNQILNDVAANFVAQGKDVRIIDVASVHYQLDSGGIHPTPQGADQLATYEAARIIEMATS